MRHAATFMTLLTALLLVPSMASAQQLKIAVVDVQKAIRTIPAGKAAKKKLEREAKAKQKDLDAKQEKLKKLKEQLERQANLLQENIKRQKMKNYQTQLMALQEAYMQFQQELKQKEAKLLQPILKKLEGTITKVAKEQGYTLVLEKGEARVLYALDAYDITALVIKRYGK